MTNDLRNRIINHTPYDCGWDTVFAPPVFGINSDAEYEVIEQQRALNDPKIAQLAFLLLNISFPTVMQTLCRTLCAHKRE